MSAERSEELYEAWAARYIDCSEAVRYLLKVAFMAGFKAAESENGNGELY